MESRKDGLVVVRWLEGTAMPLESREGFPGQSDDFVSLVTPSEDGQRSDLEIQVAPANALYVDPGETTNDV